MKETCFWLNAGPCSKSRCKLGRLCPGHPRAGETEELARRVEYVLVLAALVAYAVYAVWTLVEVLA